MHYDENSRTATEAAFVRMNSTMPMQYPSHHQNEQLCLFEYYYDSHYPNSTESEEPLRLWFLKHDVAAPRGETHDIRVAVRFGSDALDVKREMIEFLKLEGGIYQNAGVTILLNDDAGEAVADKKIITVSDAKKKSKEYVPEKSDMSIVIETRNKAIYIDNKYGRIVCPAKHPLVLWDCIWEAALILAAESDPPVVGKP